MVLGVVAIVWGQEVLGYPSAWRMIWSPAKTAHKPSAHAPLISVGIMRSFLEKWWETHKNPSLLFTLRCTWRVWESITHTQHNMREKIGRKRRSKSVQIWWLWTIRSSSSLWWEAQTCLDRHQTWWTHSALRVLRSVQLVWGLVE